MPPVPATHPPTKALELFASGKLEGPVHEAIRRHAVACSACRVVLSAARAEGPESTLVEFLVEPEPAGAAVPGAQPPGGGPASAQLYGPPEALVGQTVGDYVIEQPLGKGGMGIVYKARHALIGKVAAIKVLRAEVADDPGNMEALLAEARSAALVSHSSIVDIFALGHLPDGRQYIVMEFLAGEPLNSILKKQGARPVEEALELADRILAALEAAHEAHIVHRDLKPSNLFVNRDRDGALSVKLLDFGLARQQRPDAGHTRTRGLALGSPAYMAPEQVRGEVVDARADLYALGILLYETLTGTRPFRNSNMLQLMTMQLEQAPVPPRQHVPTLPLEVEQLVLHLLAKDRNARPASATVVRATVRRLRQTLTPARPSLVDLPRVAVASGVRPQATESGAGAEARPGGSSAAPGPTLPSAPPPTDHTEPSAKVPAVLPAAALTTLQARPAEPLTTLQTRPSDQVPTVLPAAPPTTLQTEPSAKGPATWPSAPPTADHTEPSGKIPAVWPDAPPTTEPTQPSAKAPTGRPPRLDPEPAAPAPRSVWRWAGAGAAVLVLGVGVTLAWPRAAPEPATTTTTTALPTRGGPEHDAPERSATTATGASLANKPTPERDAPESATPTPTTDSLPTKPAPERDAPESATPPPTTDSLPTKPAAGHEGSPGRPSKTAPEHDAAPALSAEHTTGPATPAAATGPHATPLAVDAELAPLPGKTQIKPATVAKRPALAERATALRRRLVASTPRGEEPDPMALMLLQRAEADATAARSDADRAKVEQVLRDIERNYLGR